MHHCHLHDTAMRHYGHTSRRVSHFAKFAEENVAQALQSISTTAWKHRSHFQAKNVLHLCVHRVQQPLAIVLTNEPVMEYSQRLMGPELNKACTRDCLIRAMLVVVLGQIFLQFDWAKLNQPPGKQHLQHWTTAQQPCASPERPCSDPAC